MMQKKKTSELTFIGSFENSKSCELPLFATGIAAGFPSPADDFIEKKLDLNKFLIRHPAATFFVRVDGESMVDAGIFSGDILIVDRALTPADGKIVVALINGEFTVKRMRFVEGKPYLVAENKAFAPIMIEKGMNFEIWGVVTYVIHAV